MMTGVLVASLTQVLLTNSRMLYVPCVTGAMNVTVALVSAVEGALLDPFMYAQEK